MLFFMFCILSTSTQPYCQMVCQEAEASLKGYGVMYPPNLVSVGTTKVSLATDEVIAPATFCIMGVV